MKIQILVPKTKRSATNLSIRYVSITVNERIYVTHPGMNLSTIYTIRDENNYLSKIQFNIHLSSFFNRYKHNIK